MGLFIKMLALLRSGLPLPNFKDEEATEAWIVGLAPSLSSIIATLLADMKTELAETGKVTLVLPDGEEIDLVDTYGVRDSQEIMLSLESKLAAVQADDNADVGKWGDGKFLEMLKKLLPIFIQILPFLLEPDEDVVPIDDETDPTPSPPVI